MNEEFAIELIKYLTSNRGDLEPFDLRSSEINQAIKWAENEPRPDLVLSIIKALTHRIVNSSLILSEDIREKEEYIRNLWRRGTDYALIGLRVAEKQEDLDSEIKLLTDLYRLGFYLRDQKLVLKSFQDLAEKMPHDGQQGLAYEISKVGRQMISIHPSTSISLLRMSLEMLGKLNDKPGIAANLYSLGYVNFEVGKLGQSVHFFNQAIEVGRESNYLSVIVSSLKGLSKVNVVEGNKDQAREYLEQAISILERLETPIPESTRNDLLAELSRLED